MALGPGGIDNSHDGDKKRLLQRADSFAIGSGTRESKDKDEIDEFDEAMESVLHKARKVEKESETEAKELAEHREDQAQLEATRRGGSSSPSHQPLLGLSILPGISNPNMTVGQSPESHSKKRAAGVSNQEDTYVESVSPELLQGLRKAGLDSPLATLDDPRLKGGCEGLRDDFVLSLRGHDRVYVWSQNQCHQVVSIGMRDSSIESAVGSVVECVTRRGKVDEKTTRQRIAPPGSFTLDET